jgi:hypothetical protein
MFTYLHDFFGGAEFHRGDAEEAMYWFANFNHEGQGSNLYSVLSTSQFKPGPISKGPSPRSAAEMMYQALEQEFGGTGEAAVAETSQPEPYDAETDTFQPSPRERTASSKPNDIPLQISMRMLQMKIAKAETARKVSHKDLSKMDYGQLERYYNQIERFDDSVYVPGIGWGGTK